MICWVYCRIALKIGWLVTSAWKKLLEVYQLGRFWETLHVFVREESQLPLEGGSTYWKCRRRQERVCVCVLPFVEFMKVQEFRTKNAGHSLRFGRIRMSCRNCRNLPRSNPGPRGTRTDPWAAALQGPWRQSTVTTAFKANIGQIQ